MEVCPNPSMGSIDSVSTTPGAHVRTSSLTECALGNRMASGRPLIMSHCTGLYNSYGCRIALQKYNSCYALRGRETASNYMPRCDRAIQRHRLERPALRVGPRPTSDHGSGGGGAAGTPNDHQPSNTSPRGASQNQTVRSDRRPLLTHESRHDRGAPR